GVLGAGSVPAVWGAGGLPGGRLGGGGCHWGMRRKGTEKPAPPKKFLRRLGQLWRAGGGARGTSRHLPWCCLLNQMAEFPWNKPTPHNWRSFPRVRTMKTLAAVAILAMVIVPPALAKAKRAQSARSQQGYQSSERPGYYHGYPLSDWYRDSLSSY